jgi:hypothetical protein
MNEPKNIDLVNIDWDSLRKNLVNYLKTTDFANDYDFDSRGTTVDLLLGLFAYNTTIGLHYLHILNNESFIYSAKNNSSLVKLLQTYGYTTNRYKSATALVTFSKNDSLLAQVDRYAILRAKNDKNTNVNFYYVGPKTTIDLSTTLSLYAGNKLVKEQTVTVDLDNQEVVIPDASVDIRTVVVKVNNDYWINFTNEPVIGTDENSKIFFIVNKGDKIFVKFGKNIQNVETTKGKSILSTDTVKLSYVVSNGEVGNNVSFNSVAEFISNATLSVPNVSITSNTSSGGYSSVDNEYLKYIAPRAYGYSSLVTKSDYEYVIANSGLIPEITDIDKRISVFDGQDFNDVGGTVYYSIIDLDVNSEEIDSINQLIQEKQIIGLSTEYLPSEDFTGNITITCSFDSRKSSSNKNVLKDELISSIEDQYGTKLFFNNLSKSDLISIIVNKDSGLSVSESNIVFSFEKNLDLSTQRTLRFYNQISSITSDLVLTNLSASEVKFNSTSTSVPGLDGFYYLAAYNSSGTLVKNKVGVYNPNTGLIVFYDSVVPDAAFDLIISPSSASIVAINNMAITYSVNSLTIT